VGGNYEGIVPAVFEIDLRFPSKTTRAWQGIIAMTEEYASALDHSRERCFGARWRSCRAAFNQFVDLVCCS
jgi:hypothetical protein